MPTFYYQVGNTNGELKAYKSGDTLTLADPRDFLDDHIHGTDKKPNKVIREIDAYFWLEARGKLY